MKNFFRQEPAIIVGVVQSLLVFLAAFGFNLLTTEQTAALIGLISTASLLLRGIVFSPATAEQIKAQREVLAKAVKTADTTGSVPYSGKKVAKKVLEGVVNTVIPAGLLNEAAKWGLSQDFVITAGVALTRQAIAAAKEAAKRAATVDEAQAHVENSQAERAGPS